MGVNDEYNASFSQSDYVGGYLSGNLYGAPGYDDYRHGPANDPKPSPAAARSSTDKTRTIPLAILFRAPIEMIAQLCARFQICRDILFVAQFYVIRNTVPSFDRVNAYTTCILSLIHVKAFPGPRRASGHHFLSQATGRQRCAQERHR